MKRTLCKIVSGTQLFEWYLVVNDNNDLILSQVNEDPNFNGDNACMVNNYNGNSMNELFDILSNPEHPKNLKQDSEGVYMLLNGQAFNCFKDLLERGFKIPQHQMPNFPHNQDPQVHNMAPVFNPQAQQPNSYAQVSQIRSMARPNVAYDVNSMLYGNDHYNEYDKSDFIFIHEPDNTPPTDYSQLGGHTFIHS